MHVAQPSSPRDEICGYGVIRVLPSQTGVLAQTSNDRKVVLKALEADCLLRGQLHPNIKERLARVRELAHLQVANLQSVEREGSSAYLVWEYLDGVAFEDWAAGSRSPREILVAAREIVLMVESLHMQGIVHGAIHGRNVIVGNDARFRLTHVSPLLFSDPAEDARAVTEMLKAVLKRRGDDKSALAELLEKADAELMPLRTLRARLAALIESREVALPERAPHKLDEDDVRTRKRALYAAGITAGAGVLIAGGIWFFTRLEVPASAPPPPNADTAALQPRERRGSPSSSAPNPENDATPANAVEVRVGQ